MMLTGGVDAPLARGILEGFNLMTVLTDDWNDAPERASRPFSKDRSGIVLGEGAWIYVLETLENAQNRNAKIYARNRRLRLDVRRISPRAARRKRCRTRTRDADCDGRRGSFAC